MKALLIITVLTFTTAITSAASLPRQPGRGVSTGASIGQHQKNQILVNKLMSQLGWDSSTQFEETGLNMRSLLVSLVTKDAEARKALEEVVVFIDSEQFQTASSADQEATLLQIKLTIKMMIHTVVLN